MPRLLLVSLGALLLLAPSAPARAEEADPRTAGAYEIQGYVLRQGAPYGRLSLSAYPRPDAQGLRWHVREAIDPLDASGDRVVATAVLDADLHAQEGRYNRRNRSGYIQAVWTRSDDGFDVVHTTQDYENELSLPSAPAISNFAAVLLHLRTTPLRRGVTTFTDFDPNPPAGDAYVAPLRLEQHGEAAWRVFRSERRAWIVSLSRGPQTLRIALDPTTRAFLGAVFLGMPFQFVPQGSGPVGLVDPVAAGLQTPIERAVVRTEALRARLPAPRAPLRWRGDLRLGEAKVGSVLLEAVPSAFGDDAGWAVLESRTSRTGAAEVVSEVGGFLGRDLRILRGARVEQRPAGRQVSTYVRTPGGMETVRRVDGTRQDPILLAAPAHATAGLVPILLLLRAVPETPALYSLPGFDPRFAEPPKAGTGSLVFNRADVRIDVVGRKPFVQDGRAQPALWARCSHRTGVRYDVYVDPESRDFLGLVGHLPALSYLPASETARPVDWYDAVDGAPQSARQAFVKFGRGYHLPRRDLLADAIHWPSLARQSIESGRYAEDTPEATIREDWIDVFVGMSKHRTEGDCDDLLFQIFMTSEEVQHDDGSVTLRTLPVYGGHAYRMKPIDGRWYLVAID